MKVEVLGELGRQLTKAHEWDRAEAIISLYKELTETMLQAIDMSETRAEALREILAELGGRLTQTEELNSAEVMARVIEENEIKTRLLSEVGQALTETRFFSNRTEALRTQTTEALRELSRELAQAQEWDHAKAVWAEAETAAQAIGTNKKKWKVLGQLGRNLAQMQQWDLAETVAQGIEDDKTKIEVLQELATNLVQEKNLSGYYASCNAPGYKQILGNPQLVFCH